MRETIRHTKTGYLKKNRVLIFLLLQKDIILMENNELSIIFIDLFVNSIQFLKKSGVRSGL